MAWRKDRKKLYVGSACPAARGDDWWPGAGHASVRGLAAGLVRQTQVWERALCLPLRSDRWHIRFSAATF